MSAIDLSASVQITLSAAEVVLLSACLDDLITDAATSGNVAESEAQALWNFEAALEKANPHILAANWNDILASAKNAISGRKP
ncbi:MAG: hypothetical protein WBA90_04525 [Albidovulum sp.]